MNTRCYRCGRSFTIGREAIEAAAVASAGQKFHVVYCPNCRTAIKMPMEQVMRELPPGWQPPAPAEGAAPETAAEAADTTAATKPGSEMVAVVVGVHKSHRRHRHAKSGELPGEVEAVEPIFLAEPPLTPVVEDVDEQAAPAPRERKAAKNTTVAAKKSTSTAKKTGSDSKKSAPAAKKTARKNTAPKKE
jgi:hypothetical protein